MLRNRERFRGGALWRGPGGRGTPRERCGNVLGKKVFWGNFPPLTFFGWGPPREQPTPELRDSNTYAAPLSPTRCDVPSIFGEFLKKFTLPRVPTRPRCSGTLNFPLLRFRDPRLPSTQSSTHVCQDPQLPSTQVPSDVCQESQLPSTQVPTLVGRDPQLPSTQAPTPVVDVRGAIWTTSGRVTSSILRKLNSPRGVSLLEPSSDLG